MCISLYNAHPAILYEDTRVSVVVILSAFIEINVLLFLPLILISDGMMITSLILLVRGIWNHYQMMKMVSNE